MRTLSILTAVALALIITATPAASAPYTYGQFALFGQRAAGQLWANGRAATQFAWSPQSPATSEIYWGDPAHWPPAYRERFERDGDWLMLAGFGDGTQFLPQVVTSQSIGDVNCAHMTALRIGGQRRQRYVRWTIPEQAYCMRTTGYVQYRAQRVSFEHTQVWFPPSGPTCSTEYFTGEICIKHYEVWRDDNGAPGSTLTEKIRRDNIYALGKGWFIIRDWRSSWEARGRYYWHW